jgi:hypothetical protein
MRSNGSWFCRIKRVNARRLFGHDAALYDRDFFAAIPERFKFMKDLDALDKKFGKFAAAALKAYHRFPSWFIVLESLHAQKVILPANQRVTKVPRIPVCQRSITE